jgi:hypothetical protein
MRDSQQQDAARGSAVTMIEPIGLTVRETMQVEKCAAATVYVRLASGEYKGFKDGFKTLITIESIIRRRESLPSWSAASTHKRPPPRRVTAVLNTKPRRKRPTYGER